MAGPIKLEINHTEMLNDHGVEWSMSFEEVLGGNGKCTIRVQNRDGAWEPTDHWDVKATVRSTGWVLFRGEIITHGFDLEPGTPWITWALNCSDYNGEPEQRKIGAYDGKLWLDTSGLGVFINIDPYGITLDTDKLTIQSLFDHYFRVDGQSIETTTYVNQYLDEIFPIEWSYGDLQKALEEMAALIQDNLQFWIDPDLYFHWVTIPAWQDLLQDATLVGADPTASASALLAPEAGVGEIPFAPYNVVDVDPDLDPEGDVIGFSKLNVSYDGGDMPQQVYVKGGTGYVYNAPALLGTENKTTVKAPTPGAADSYELTFLESSKLWHTDSTGYVSVSYDWGSGGPYRVKWVKVAWNEARNKGGSYWKLLEGPYNGKLVDNDTNVLNGYGGILVQKVATVPGEPLVGVGGSGWVGEVDQDPNKRQAYLEAPISTTKSKRDSLGGQVLYRGKTPTLRGSVEVYGLDGWRVGQAMKITDERLPASLNNRFYIIQRVGSTLLEGNDLRRYKLDFGDGPKSRWSMRQPPGDITWPPPFAYIELDVFDLSPGPNSTQRITGQLVSASGEPWKIAGKTVNWSFECYDNVGTRQTDQGSIAPHVSITDKNGRAYTKLTTGPGTSLVYYVFADVKAT
jgi:hypothetical protein